MSRASVPTITLSLSQQPAQEEKEARGKPMGQGRGSRGRRQWQLQLCTWQTGHLSSGCERRDIWGRSSLLGDLTGLGAVCPQQATGDMACWDL